ncbi:MAG TPA: tetratricopeptide repeat protein [Candidatus Eisenbacteria bacterium]|nr:tetratricopeptide repeat protein [Candidatus Eisenbacteria bacterium]
MSRARAPRATITLVFAVLAGASSVRAQAPVAIEPAPVARARLDSLMAIVKAEEARVRAGLGIEVNWDRLARAWFQVGDHGRAAKSLERARAIGAREFDTVLLSGRVARSEGRFAEAVDWLERAVRMRPDDWEAHEDLGHALYLEGRFAAAAQHWDRARALPGSGSPDRSALTAVLRTVGEAPYRITGRGRERVRFVPQGTRGGLVMPVTVNGRGPLLFRIDAGSPECVLASSVARELGLVAGEADAAGDRLAYTVLDSLAIGATTLHRLPVGVSGHPGFATEGGVRGLLGFEALRRFRFCVDPRDSMLTLEPLPPAGAQAPADSARPAWLPAGAAAHRVPVLLRGTHLLIAYGRVNQGPERPFLLDIGSPGPALAAPASTLDEAGVAIDSTRVQTGTSAGGRVGYLDVQIARLCIGGACRDSLAGAYGTFPARLELNPNFRLAGVVSNGFLAGYRCAVDLSRAEAWLIEP